MLAFSAKDWAATALFLTGALVLFVVAVVISNLFRVVTSLKDLVDGITSESVPLIGEVGNTVRGRLRFVVMGRSGSYQTDASRMPLRGMVVLDPPTAATGECGEAVFPGPPGGTCVFNSVGSMLRCR